MKQDWLFRRLAEDFLLQQPSEFRHLLGVRKLLESLAFVHDDVVCPPACLSSPLAAPAGIQGVANFFASLFLFFFIIICHNRFFNKRSAMF